MSFCMAKNIIENYSWILIIRLLVVDTPPLQRNIHLRKHGEDGLLNNKIFKKTLEACFSPPGLMKALPAYLELCTSGLSRTVHFRFT